MRGTLTSMRYFCTYFDHNYLPQGLAMYCSLRRWCPEAQLFVLTLSREAHKKLQASRRPGITLITLEEFEAFDPALLAVKGNRSKVEYIFTSTPCLCRYVFRNFLGVDLLTYLDADLYFFSEVRPMFTELGEASIGIIPHGYSSSRYHSYGRFNVGWISLRRDPSGLACVEWWRERCLEWCKDVVEPTRYADQKYLDRWPDLFAKVHIFTNPGANLARWNIKNRQVSQAQGRLLVNGQPLIFFHFASFRQLATWLYQPNFATHWVVPSRLVRGKIFGQYIAELQAIAGPVLPRSPRRLKLQEIGLGHLPKFLGQALRFARAALLRDYVVIPDSQRHAAKFAKVLDQGAWVGRYSASDPAAIPTAWFIYADTPGFSGQKEAARLIFENLRPEQMGVKFVRVPALNRTGFILGGFISLFGQMVKMIAAMSEATISPHPVVHVSLGQTKAALLRDAFPLFMIMWWRHEKSAIVSLNGSNFMNWSAGCFEARCLRLIMAQAAKLTVLGETQFNNALRLGIPRDKVCIVYNTCDADGMDETEIASKQRDEDGPFRLLHLSSLIDTKGYPTYLEALELLAGLPGRKIDAVLCGNMVSSAYGVRFKTQLEAGEWIRAKIDRINQSARIKVQWIPGATGASKWQLYRDAHGFVFPSLYHVEAQPLVLLEAMTHGCVVVSSAVGEIRTMLNGVSATLLENPEAETVAAAITMLIGEPEARLAMAMAAKRIFSLKFSKQIYMKTWVQLLRSVSGESE